MTIEFRALWAHGHAVTHLGERAGEGSFCKAHLRFPDVLLWDSDDHETTVALLRQHSGPVAKQVYPDPRNRYCTRCAAEAERLLQEE